MMPSSAPLHVLHVDSGQEWQAVRDQVRLLIQGLREDPQIRQAVATHGSSRLAAECRDLGIPVIPLPWAAGNDPRPLRELARHARDGWDVYHAHDKTALAIVLYIQALVGSDASLVASRRHSAPPMATGRWHRSDVVLAVSEPARDALVRAGIERRRVVVVPNCVVAEEFNDVPDGILREAVGAQPGHELVASFTGLLPHRDHETLIRAAGMLGERQPQTRFVVLGRGPERERLEDLIADANLGGRVCLPGFLADARQYMRELSVFVMPSLEPEVTSACLEAMAAGIPVIMPAGSNSRPAPTAATAVPPRDPEALADAIHRLLSDAEYRRSVIAEGREYALRFGPPALVRRTVEAYRAVSRHRSRRELGSTRAVHVVASSTDRTERNAETSG